MLKVFKYISDLSENIETKKKKRISNLKIKNLNIFEDSLVELNIKRKKIH